MFKIKQVKIDGFWCKFTAKCKFKKDVNIIIGKNGTGKTTFMNILHAVLTADIEELGENDFEAVEIYLEDGKSNRTVKATRLNDENFPFQVIEYQISREKYRLRIIPSDDRRTAITSRRRAMMESTDLRKHLSDLVALSSISVYRLRSHDNYEIRDRHGATRIVSPVDYRLSELLSQLMMYQLEISQEARAISTKLQKDVLVSILYSKEYGGDERYLFDFKKEQEKTKLIKAYTHLGAIDSSVKKRIDFHVAAVDRTVSGLEKLKSKSKTEVRKIQFDTSPLDAWRKTRKIIDLSLEAEEKITEIFSQIDLFIKTIASFIVDKKFSFESGKLAVRNSDGKIDHDKLSSGEKQLLILLIEALLQNRRSHIFLADEPELSLHIEWQQMIIPAVRELNPNAQVIAATHSPEVASQYRNSMINMKEVVNG